MNVGVLDATCDIKGLGGSLAERDGASALPLRRAASSWALSSCHQGAVNMVRSHPGDDKQPLFKLNPSVQPRKTKFL